MRYFKYCTLFIILFYTSSCEWKTNTPKKYLNENRVSIENYNQDAKNLKKLVLSYVDSIDRNRNPKPKSKILDVEIDTIFYGDENEMAFLAIFKRNNPYVKLVVEPEYQDGIDYRGGCFLAKKESARDIRILDRLKHSANSKEDDGYQRVKKKLREIYLEEMNHIDGKYNINDVRFWESDAWNRYGE